MITTLSLIAIIAGSIVFILFYIISVQPVKLSRTGGGKAFSLCGKLRLIAGAAEGIIFIGYGGLAFNPPVENAWTRYPWPWWVSLIAGVVLFIPPFRLMMAGIKNAGQESLFPDPSHTMYGGVYEKIRHPQALGESFLFPVIGLMFHSPVLTLGSFLWLPIFYLFCVYEEKDLVLRYGDAFKEYQARVGMFIPRKTGTVD